MHSVETTLTIHVYADVKSYPTNTCYSLTLGEIGLVVCLFCTILSSKYVPTLYTHYCCSYVFCPSATFII